MSKKLVITEKPSVAKDIALVLGRFSSRDGYLENDEYIITWAVGHLIQLGEPEDYNTRYKRWRLEDLPIIPKSFILKPNQATAKQLNIIGELIQHKPIAELINACDAGREGELIFRYIIEYLKIDKPFKRLWISSMTEEAIKKGFMELKAGEHYNLLADAARCRSESDWLVGINCTRAVTSRFNELFSVGRVQTPTLALVVEREKEILQFTPVPYFQLEAKFRAGQDTYTGTWFKGKEDRLATEAEAANLASKLQGLPGKVTEVSEKEQKQQPPLLFDLTELQREMNKRYGMSAAQTLKVAQSLYEEKKLITYPRTDSRFLTQDMVSGLKGIMQNLAVKEFQPFVNQLLALSKLPINKKIVDDKKVSDHHAIIPTNKRPHLQGLSKDQFRVYEAVVKRFLAVFFPAAVVKHVQVVTKVGGEGFKSKTKVLLEPGWRAVYGAEPEEDEAGSFPKLVKGQEVSVEEFSVLTKETKPPKRYTEASLLSAMETAGKLIDDEDLREAMKDGGLGTPATRAGIIERLIHVGYIQRKGKTLLPTEKGTKLIDNLPVKELSSPELTGTWEKRLSDLQKGLTDRDSFSQDVQSFVRMLVDSIRVGKCPRCGRPLIKGRQAWGCSGWREGCNYVVGRS